jgi:catechol 2,3-dioxygenase-like lactoylglutathione lyase family enzyme
MAADRAGIGKKRNREDVIMDLARAVSGLSRRETLALLGAIAVARPAGAAEQGLLRPVSLDHVNIRVSDVAKTGAFFMALFDTPVLRNPALRARPTSPPSEGFFLKFGDGYLAISQAFAPEMPGLDHYSVGLADYEQAKLAARLQGGGIPAEARSSDIWVHDLDEGIIQLRTPGGWARQTATPYQGAARGALSPLSMSRIALSAADLARGGGFYERLFGAALGGATGPRAFSLGDSVLELVGATAEPRGMDHLRIAVKDFSVEATGRVLRERNIAFTPASGTLRISDPDGIRIELAAAG